ncbi:MAG: indolepyruvate oxidoreductase subunit beta [Candidatus Njordarchaeales archaeon]
MTDIVLTGVGGQGIVFASNLLATAAMNNGYKVKLTHRKGLAQRGGSVLSFVRIYQNTNVSPIIPFSKADLLLGFEVLESLRNINYVKSNGVAVINFRKIEPVNIKIGMHQYPSDDEIRRILNNSSIKYYLIDAREIALSTNNPRGENVALVGFAAGLELLPISKDALIEAIRTISPPKYAELNIRTLERAYQRAQEVK